MKKTNDNNVIKSMLIGISAFITMVIASGSMSMDVYAADGEPDASNGGDNQNSQEAEQTAPTIDNVKQDADDAAKEAAATVSDVQEVVDYVDNNEFFSAETGNNTIDQNNGAIVNATATLGTELDGPKDADNTADAVQLTGELQSTLEELDQKDTDISATVRQLNDKIADANDAAQAGSDAVEAAKDALGLGEASEGSISDAITEAKTAVDQAEQKIGQASSETEANGYLQDADNAVNEASDKVDTARTNFEKASADYDTAKAAYDTAEGKIKEYRDILEGTTDENGEQKGGLLAEYETLQKEASEQAKAAAAEFDILKKDAENLKKKTDNAYKAYIGSGYEHIADLEQKISKANDPSWDDYRALAIAMIETYYIPEELHGEVTQPTQWFKDWSSYGGTYKYPDGKTSSPGDVLNYGLVKYKDANGDEQELYFNYKTANANTKNNKGGVVIFEKVKHNMLNGTELTDDEVAALDDEQRAAVKVEYRNDNWYSGNLIIAEYDGQNFKTDNRQTGSGAVDSQTAKISVEESKNDVFRANADDAGERIKNYLQLSEKAQKAIESAKSMKETINNIKADIDKLTGSKPTISVLNEMSTGLQTYADILQKAEEDRGTLVSRLGELKGYIASKFPAPAPSAGDNNETSDADDSGEGDEVGALGAGGDSVIADGGDGGSDPAAPVAPAAPAGGRVAAAGAGIADEGTDAASPATVIGARNGDGAAADNGGMIADAGAGDEEIIIGDGQTALAASIDEAAPETIDQVDETVKSEDTVKKDDTIKIEDEDSALADTFEKNEITKGWPWWILALVTGAVTFEEYKRRQRNKKAAQVSSTEADK